MQIFDNRTLASLVSSNFAVSQAAEDLFISKHDLAPEDNFYLAPLLDRRYGPALPFTIEGFFLQSSIDVRIKSVPIFLFALQRRDLRETYISCFYAENYPKLLEQFLGSENDGSAEDYAVRFNWFDHEYIVPEPPMSMDDISKTFYYTEGKFLDYRVFDATRKIDAKKDRSVNAIYFDARFYLGGGHVRRSRFYRRKFN